MTSPHNSVNYSQVKYFDYGNSYWLGNAISCCLDWTFGFMCFSYWYLYYFYEMKWRRRWPWCLQNRNTAKTL